jgi:hypothetical protein
MQCILIWSFTPHYLVHHKQLKSLKTNYYCTSCWPLDGTSSVPIHSIIMLRISSRQLLNTSRLASRPASQLPVSFQHSRLASSLRKSPSSSILPTVYRPQALSLLRSPLQQQWTRSSSMKPPGSGPPLGPPKQASEAVSATSTTRAVFDEVGDDVDQARSGTHHKEKAVPVQNALVADLVSCQACTIS